MNCAHSLLHSKPTTHSRTTPGEPKECGVRRIKQFVKETRKMRHLEMARDFPKIYALLSKQFQAERISQAIPNFVKKFYKIGHLKNKETAVSNMTTR